VVGLVVVGGGGFFFFFFFFFCLGGVGRGATYLFWGGVS
jgi:hypothetical protein